MSHAMVFTKLSPERQREVFAALCKTYGLPPPVYEYRYIEGRKFRADYAWPQLRLVVEQEGGIYNKKDHGSITGILRDIEKYNLATVQGWSVLRVVPKMMTHPDTFAMIRECMAMKRQLLLGSDYYGKE